MKIKFPWPSLRGACDEAIQKRSLLTGLLRRKLLAMTATGLILLQCGVIYANPIAWKAISPGLEYTRLGDFANFPNGYIHVFRIDLKHYDLKIGLTQKNNDTSLSLPQLMQAQHAVLATNGGFFTPDFKPLGLRISQGQMLSPIKLISWWGVFLISNDRAQVVSEKNFQQDSDINFAIQAGPRLLTHGVIPKLKLDIDYRTALGVVKGGQVVLLVTDNLMLSTIDLATIMKKPEAEGGLNCVDAINLDGGHSTQLYTHLDNFSLAVESFTPVGDAVLVVPK